MVKISSYSFNNSVLNQFFSAEQRHVLNTFLNLDLDYIKLYKLMKLYFVFITFVCFISSCNVSNKEQKKSDIYLSNELTEKLERKDSSNLIINKIKRLNDIGIYKGKEIPREILTDYFSNIIFLNYYSKVFLDSIKQESNYKALFLTMECLSGEKCLEQRMVTISDTIIDYEMIRGSFIGNFESDEFTYLNFNDTIVRINWHYKFTEQGDTNYIKQNIRKFIINEKGEFIEQKG